MAVQITFDLANEQDRKIVMEFIGRVEVANQIIGTAAKVAEPQSDAPVVARDVVNGDVDHDPESFEPSPIETAEIDVPMLKRAVLDAHKRVGRRSIELLGEYGGKCEKIEEGKRGEFLERLRGLK